MVTMAANNAPSVFLIFVFILRPRTELVHGEGIQAR